MNDIIFRKGPRVHLRPVEKADAPRLRQWLNDPAITQYLARATPLMEIEEEEWIAALHKRTEDFVLSIVDTQTSTHIGSIGLHSINWRSRTATTGTVIGEKEYHGKGYGTEAKMLLLDFAFNTLDLYAILSRALATNERSINYSKRCGYEVVGRIPNWIRTQHGERVDEVHLIVTQEQWRPLWAEFQQKVSTTDS